MIEATEFFDANFWLQGYGDYWDDVPLNGYPDGLTDAQHRSWERGWFDAAVIDPDHEFVAGPPGETLCETRSRWFGKWPL